MHHSLCRWPRSMPLETAARMMPAVASGRSVRLSPPWSVKVYISFSTTSVNSPMARLKSSVCSTTGTRISSYPYSVSSSRALASRCCQVPIWAGSTSFIPRTGWICAGNSTSVGLLRPDGASIGVDEEVRATVGLHHGAYRRATAVDLDRNTWSIAQHDAERRCPVQRARGVGGADVVEKALARGVVHF